MIRLRILQVIRVYLLLMALVVIPSLLYNYTNIDSLGKGFIYFIELVCFFFVWHSSDDIKELKVILNK